ncbi:hypothetical protein E2C01_064661 [Portunus trituberculatus]|uniref:Uncharacterized protein n=1 Tax=Portunus trituberculatus TaxID=210409 RepID=A0A5B7HGQ6_PORTR|nr:hypothetical protein [Portunus trituberculatus]
MSGSERVTPKLPWKPRSSRPKRLLVPLLLREEAGVSLQNLPKQTGTLPLTAGRLFGLPNSHCIQFQTKFLRVIYAL